MTPTCEMDAAHAIEFASLLLVGSLIFGTFIAAAVMSFLNTVAAFKRREPPFVEVNLQKPARPGDNLSNRFGETSRKREATLQKWRL